MLKPICSTARIKLAVVAHFSSYVNAGASSATIIDHVVKLTHTKKKKKLKSKSIGSAYWNDCSSN